MLKLHTCQNDEEKENNKVFLKTEMRIGWLNMWKPRPIFVATWQGFHMYTSKWHFLSAGIKNLFYSLCVQPPDPLFHALLFSELSWNDSKGMLVWATWYIWKPANKSVWLHFGFPQGTEKEENNLKGYFFLRKKSCSYFLRRCMLSQVLRKTISPLWVFA